jgi:hypothetical protein
MPCPAGLEWNDKKKECDWPQDSTCPNKPSTEPTTNRPDNGFQCPRDNIANNGCLGPKDCLYPNPAYCNSFIQCVPLPDGSSKSQVMPCPAGLEWNGMKKECDWPQDSTCPNKPPTEPDL